MRVQVFLSFVALVGWSVFCGYTTFVEPFVLVGKLAKLQGYLLDVNMKVVLSYMVDGDM